MTCPHNLLPSPAWLQDTLTGHTDLHALPQLSLQWGPWLPAHPGCPRAPRDCPAPLIVAGPGLGLWHVRNLVHG